MAEAEHPRDTFIDSKPIIDINLSRLVTAGVGVGETWYQVHPEPK